MQVYEKEILHGITNLGDKITADCIIVDSSDFSGKVDEDLAKTIARYAPSNPEQIDLHYLTCILVSEGWNKNDDVFEKPEIWSAKSTPEDKPFNYQHDESDIIGHMTGSVVLDKSGNKVSGDTEFTALPDNLDIAVSAVIYKCWSDPEQLVRIKELVEEISKGEWSVSMECLFKSFDYAVVTPEGESKIIARDENSAFLTKHLRAYGGTGFYEGYKIGRLLRNISFSAIGLVKRPANPRSVILNTNNSLGELKMADLAKTAASVAETELTEKVSDLENQLTKANTKLTEVEATKSIEIATLQADLKKANTDLSAAKAETQGVMEQLKAMQEKLRCMERRSTLASMNIDPEVVEELLEKFSSLDDTAFCTAISLCKAMRPNTYAETQEDLETESEVELETTDVEDKSKDVAIANTTDPDTEKTQAGIRNWFAKSVLSTTKHLK